MNALRKLEKGGYRFELLPDGRLHYQDMWPSAGSRHWAAPLLAEVIARTSDACRILRCRQAWGQLFDQWSWLLAQGASDLQSDIDYLRQLGRLAADGAMVCYDSEENDLGAEGWQMLVERQIRQLTGEPIPAEPDCKNSVPQKENQIMGIRIEQTTYDAVPTGDYKAVITEITSVEGKFGPQLQIKSEISSGPYAGNTFMCWVSPKFSPKSRLYEWVEAALVMPVPKTYTFDSDHLIGREVVATLVVRELDGGGEVNRVDRVRAAKGGELGITN